MAKPSYSRPKRTKADARAALGSLLIMADSLEKLNLESLARTHGLPVDEVATRLDTERKRRAIRDAPSTEIAIQVAFRNALRIKAPAVSIVAIPNAAKRGPAAIRQAKLEGMATGFPDVACLWSGGGAFIEFKTEVGKVSENQAEWIDRLNGMGHRAKVCRSADEALAFLRRCGAPFNHGEVYTHG